MPTEADTDPTIPDEVSVAVGQRLSVPCEMALKYSVMYGFSVDLSQCFAIAKHC